MAYQLEKQTIPCDENGFLADLNQWSVPLAHLIANEYDLILDDDHIQVIQFIRDFYKEYDSHPATRLIVAHMKTCFPKDKATSATLHHLFPEPMLRTLCHIAGLPKPRRCL